MSVDKAAASMLRTSSAVWIELLAVLVDTSVKNFHMYQEAQLTTAMRGKNCNLFCTHAQNITMCTKLRTMSEVSISVMMHIIKFRWVKKKRCRLGIHAWFS
jgi:hypothetical protein